MFSFNVPSVPYIDMGHMHVPFTPPEMGCKILDPFRDQLLYLLLDDFGRQSTMSPAGMYAYNRMSNYNWNNPDMQAAYQTAARLAKKQIEARVHTGINKLLTDTAKHVGSYYRAKYALENPGPCRLTMAQNKHASDVVERLEKYLETSTTPSAKENPEVNPIVQIYNQNGAWMAIYQNGAHGMIDQNTAMTIMAQQQMQQQPMMQQGVPMNMGVSPQMSQMRQQAMMLNNQGMMMQQQPAMMTGAQASVITPTNSVFGGQPLPQYQTTNSGLFDNRPQQSAARSLFGDEPATTRPAQDSFATQPATQRVDLRQRFETASRDELDSIPVTAKKAPAAPAAPAKPVWTQEPINSVALKGGSRVVDSGFEVRGASKIIANIVTGHHSRLDLYNRLIADFGRAEEPMEENSKWKDLINNQIPCFASMESAIDGIVALAGDRSPTLAFRSLVQVPVVRTFHHPLATMITALVGSESALAMAHSLRSTLNVIDQELTSAPDETHEIIQLMTWIDSWMTDRINELLLYRLNLDMDIDSFCSTFDELRQAILEEKDSPKLYQTFIAEADLIAEELCRCLMGDERRAILEELAIELGIDEARIVVINQYATVTTLPFFPNEMGLRCLQFVPQSYSRDSAPLLFKMLDSAQYLQQELDTPILQHWLVLADGTRYRVHYRVGSATTHASVVRV